MDYLPKGLRFPSASALLVWSRYAVLRQVAKPSGSELHQVHHPTVPIE